MKIYKIMITMCVILLTIVTGCEVDGLFIMTAFDTFGAAVNYDDSAATDRLEVAAATIKSTKNDKAANITAIESMVTEIKTAHPTIQVIVFGELILGSLYDQDDQAGYQQSIAETIPGASTNAVLAIANANNVFIVFGMAENDGGNYYNSQVIAFPDGLTLLKYRKRGLNNGDIEAGFKRGDSLVSVTIYGIQVTFMICSDYQEEDVIRDVSRSDAEVVLMSAGNPTRLSMENDYVARQINKWVIHGNRSDTGGLSYIADPTGSFRVQAKGDYVYAFRNIGVYK